METSPSRLFRLGDLYRYSHEPMIPRQYSILLLVLALFHGDGLAQQAKEGATPKRYAGAFSDVFAQSNVQIDLTATPVEISTRNLFRLRYDENRHAFWFDASDIKPVTDRKQLDSLYDSVGKAPHDATIIAYRASSAAYTFNTNVGVPGKMLRISWLLIVCSTDGKRAEIVSDCINVDKPPKTQTLVQVDKLEPGFPSE